MARAKCLMAKKKRKRGDRLQQPHGPDNTHPLITVGSYRRILKIYSALNFI